MIRDWTIVQAGKYNSTSEVNIYTGDTQVFSDIVSLSPSPGTETSGKSWLQHGDSGSDDYIELSEIDWGTGHEYAVWYAVVYIDSPSTRTAILRTDQDDYLRMWVNGVQVADYAGLDVHNVSVTLKDGINTLLIRVVNVTGPGGYSVSIIDPSTNSEYTDLTYYTTKPEEVVVSDDGTVTTSNEDEVTAETIANDLLGGTLSGYDWAVSSDGTVVFTKKESTEASTPSYSEEKWYESSSIKIVSAAVFVIILIAIYYLYKRGKIPWL